MVIRFILFLYLCPIYQGAVVWNNKKIMNNYETMDGDIRIPISQSRVAVKYDDNLWPNATVYFTIDVENMRNDALNLARLGLAMRMWEMVTCINFRYRDDQPDYVYFRRTWDDICDAVAGKTEGKQNVNLASSCFVIGTLVHEVGHVLGLLHEHNRPDRDNYIAVIWKNIYDDKYRRFFTKYPADIVRVLGEYDYDSIMHYGRRVFAKTNRMTLGSKISGKKLREVEDKIYMSPGDAETINKLYHCSPTNN